MKHMPYPVHAMRLGEAHCRDILGPDYDVYSVMFCYPSVPWISKMRISAKSLHYPLSREYGRRDSGFVQSGPGKYSTTSLGDRNMPVNSYNDHYFFTDWHWAVEYMTRCTIRSSGTFHSAVTKVAELQPEDGVEYNINGWVFPAKHPKPIKVAPPPPAPVREPGGLGDILARAIKIADFRRREREREEARNNFGYRWGIKG